MSYPNIFQAATTQAVIDRIEKLTAETQPLWGKMAVDQMLAHCNVTYEMSFEDLHPKPNAFVKLMMKAFVKKAVVGEKPYPKNGRTAPQFVITEPRDFEIEKARLIAYLRKAQGIGELGFDQRESHSFGKLSTGEWSIMFYKHLDHHLQQFGT